METKLTNVPSLPSSKIYVSVRSELTCTVKDPVLEVDRVIHFFLIHDVGQGYTQEDVSECKGKYRCFSCNRKIKFQIFFFPIRYTKLEELIVSPLPHCRAACALHTVVYQPNNCDLLSCFYLMYGLNVIVAPPRQLLFGPNAMSSEEYHAQIDASIVIEVHQTPMVHAFLAPVYYSCSEFKNHQLSKAAQDVVEALTQEPKTSIGPERIRETTGMNAVVVMPAARDISNLYSTFKLDPLSHRETK